MGRKKVASGAANRDDRPFCFYCDRTFEDEAVVIQHQRAKHFRCTECDDGVVRGKCESVQGLIVHTLKVHGKSLTKVPNALPGRDGPELQVYGMDGLPEWFLKERGMEPPAESSAPPPAPPSSSQPPPPGPPTPPPTPPPALPTLPELPIPMAFRSGLLPTAGLLGSLPPPTTLPAPALQACPAPPPQPVPDACGAGCPLPVPATGPTAPSATMSPNAAFPTTPGFLGAVPDQGSAPGNGLPAPAPPAPVASHANGSAEVAAAMHASRKRCAEDISGEDDVSVEELRAQLDQYRFPKSR